VKLGYVPRSDSTELNINNSDIIHFSNLFIYSVTQEHEATVKQAKRNTYTGKTIMMMTIMVMVVVLIVIIVIIVMGA
jgi:hypothetical protein